jgi:hypothetical protein
VEPQQNLDGLPVLTNRAKQQSVEETTTPINKLALKEQPSSEKRGLG